jgi:hypothetical protein
MRSNPVKGLQVWIASPGNQPPAICQTLAVAKSDSAPKRIAEILTAFDDTNTLELCVCNVLR